MKNVASQVSFMYSGETLDLVKMTIQDKTYGTVWNDVLEEVAMKVGGRIEQPVIDYLWKETWLLGF